MFGGSLVFHLVCLLWFAISLVNSFGRPIYYAWLARERGGTTYRRKVPGFVHTSNFRLPQVISVGPSYSNTNKEWSTGIQRQQIYDGSDYGWDSNVPSMEEMPTWPPDYSAWPQASTQSPPQLVSRVPPMLPTQYPIQAPFQPPSAVGTQSGSSYSPTGVMPQGMPGTYSVQQAQIWRTRSQARQDGKSIPSRPATMVIRRASRACSPGPPLGVNPLFRNCLIIGDSISLGYLTTVKSELQGLCQVQHAPFAKGSGAVDSRYGLKCLSMMLHTTTLERTSYDAVVFNFGMHDINYSKMFPEEFVPLEEYKDNLGKIKELLLQSGAQVAFALTTPVPIAGRRNRRVVTYNKEAKRVMAEGRKVEIVDLHSAVVRECGEPPYNTCSIMKRPKDVHFNPKGNKLLGLKVAVTLRKLLSKAKPRGNFSPPKVPELSAREGLASSYLHDDTSFCPDMVTRCPARTTCCENLLSLTGYGCCMEPDAVICPDSWHCCPRGYHCASNCNFRSCKCILISSPTAMSKLQNEGNKTNVKVSNVNTTSPSGSHSVAVKLGKPGKPGRPSEPGIPSEPVKAVKQNHKNTKQAQGNGRKDTGAEKKRKQKQEIKKGGKKRPKDHNDRMSHKHDQYKKRVKKHKKHKKSMKRRVYLKLEGKAKEETLEKKKGATGKGIKAIQKINKHIVKAHATHQRTNYHPSTKQHWITIFNNGIEIATKHRPNIKFAHTWGRRKHQDLSYKANGKKKKEFHEDISMTDELKHLISKHQELKLRTRLRLHEHETHSSLTARARDQGKFQRLKNKIKKSIYSSKSLNQRNVGLHMRKKLNLLGNGIKDSKTSRLTEKKKKLIQLAESQKAQRSRKKTGMTIELVHEVRKEFKVKKNLTLPEHKNKKTVDQLKFKVTQTLEGNPLLKKNVSETLSPFKTTRDVLNRSGNNLSQIKNLGNVTLESQIGKLQNNTDNSTLESDFVAGSVPKPQMSSDTDWKENLARPDFFKGSSLDEFGFHELGSSSVAGSSLPQVLMGVGSDFLLKPGNESKAHGIITGSGIRSNGPASGYVSSSSYLGEQGDLGAGEDEIEQGGNDDSGGFDADELTTGSADGFGALTSASKTSKNVTTGIGVMQKKRENRVKNGSGSEVELSSAESVNGSVVPSSATNSNRNPNYGQDSAMQKGHDIILIGVGRVLKSGLGRSSQGFSSGFDAFSSLSDDDTDDVSGFYGSRFGADESFMESAIHQDNDDSNSGLYFEKTLGKEGNDFNEFDDREGIVSGHTSSVIPTDNEHGVFSSVDMDSRSTASFNLENFSADSGSGIHLVAQGDNDEQRASQDNNHHSHDPPDIYAGLFPAHSVQSSLNLMANQVRRPQGVLYQYNKRDFHISSNEISQTRYNDGYNVTDNDKGYNSHYDESNVLWGNGEYSLPEDKASGQVKRDFSGS